jgi:hypothetical protein
MRPKESSAIRNGKRLMVLSLRGELVYIGEGRPGVRVYRGICLWISLVLASWLFSLSAMAQPSSGDAPEPVSGEEAGSGDAPAPVSAEEAEAPLPAAQPEEATLQVDEEPRGTVVFSEPEYVEDRTGSVTTRRGAAKGPGPTAGQQSVPEASRVRDDASGECELSWMRDGFYLRIVDGVGFAHLSGDGPSGSASVSGLGSISTLAIGSSIARRLVLAFLVQAAEASSDFEGGPLAGATLSVDGNETPASETAIATASVLGGFLDWYPMESSGLHLGIGAGLNIVTLVNNADDSTLVGVGGGGTLLVGYDWPVARTWALGVALVASGASSASLKDSESGDDTDYELMPFAVGLSASLLHF